jgi:oligopeptidase A
VVEVLSADAYAAFEETAAANDKQETTSQPSCWQKIPPGGFEAGGSRSAMESSAAFRGREPFTDALLCYQGIT